MWEWKLIAPGSSKVVRVWVEDDSEGDDDKKRKRRRRRGKRRNPVQENRAIGNAEGRVYTK